MSLFALAADNIQCWCPRLEVSTGSCSDLHCISEIFRPTVSPQAPEAAVPSAQWNGSYSLFLLPVHLHRPGPCILCGWPLCMERVPLAPRLHPMILSNTFGTLLGIDVKNASRFLLCL